MPELPPDEPEMKLPNLFTELSSEELRVTGIEDIIKNLWVQIKRKTEVSTIKKSISKKFNLSISSIERLVSGRSSLPIQFVKEVYEIWKEICKPSQQRIEQIDRQLNEFSMFKGDSNSMPVTLPKALTPKLAYLLGALRDGSILTIYNNQYEVQFSQKNVKWLRNVIIPTIEEVFKIKTKVQRYGEQTPRIKVYSKPIYIFIKKVFKYPEKLQVTWEVPSLVMHSPLEIKRWFIRGFFDSEGEINIKQKRLVIHHSWNGENPVVLKQLQEILINDFGIESKISKPHKERNFPSFDLTIFKENILLFYQRIGTSHPQKIIKFQLLKGLLTAHSLAA